MVKVPEHRPYQTRLTRSMSRAVSGIPAEEFQWMRNCRVVLDRYNSVSTTIRGIQNRQKRNRSASVFIVRNPLTSNQNQENNAVLGKIEAKIEPGQSLEELGDGIPHDQIDDVPATSTSKTDSDDKVEIIEEHGEGIPDDQIDDVPATSTSKTDSDDEVEIIIDLNNNSGIEEGSAHENGENEILHERNQLVYESASSPDSVEDAHEPMHEDDLLHYQNSIVEADLSTENIFEGLTDESEIVESVPISVGTNENQIIGLPSDEINSEIAANENTNASMENDGVDNTPGSADSGIPTENLELDSFSSSSSWSNISEANNEEMLPLSESTTFVKCEAYSIVDVQQIDDGQNPQRVEITANACVFSLPPTFNTRFTSPSENHIPMAQFIEDGEPVNTNSTDE